MRSLDRRIEGALSSSFIRGLIRNLSKGCAFNEPPKKELCLDVYPGKELVRSVLRGSKGSLTRSFAIF